ncbi:chemotaxis response regulator protein-glutamate methylesterase [Maricurvus nonylphenolicus]|uniref:protein-glutamate methylesterase/protein-glutamine glutaminase n=1 Tax=Maricurvus nonylphenolicus TaxID=1008307 RepID=UPI0036F3AD7F
MPINVLVVDDSNFFQHRLKEIINAHSELNVVGVAANGREAVDMAQSLKPDVITMDYEMPVMDGVSAVRQIMAQRPVPILMFSSMTYEGARTTLDALDAGATDFMPKNFAEVSRDSAALKKKLHDRLLQIARPQRLARSATPAASFKAPPAPERKISLKGRVNLLVIGASTGGPVALADVLTKLPANFPVPIVLVQHMPENFTKAFADRLNRQCKIEVREAVDGDQLRPGLALLAPGGKQLMVEKRGMGCVRVLPGDSRVNYKPSVDITFGSAANTYDKHVLGVVLTGMGSDGCEGARLLKRKGSAIWSQDQASCVIYGMPMAVAREKLTDRVLPLNEIGSALAREL